MIRRNIHSCVWCASNFISDCSINSSWSQRPSWLTRVRSWSYYKHVWWISVTLMLKSWEALTSVVDHACCPIYKRHHISLGNIGNRWNYCCNQTRHGNWSASVSPNAWWPLFVYKFGSTKMGDLFWFTLISQKQTRPLEYEYVLLHQQRTSVTPCILSGEDTSACSIDSPIHARSCFCVLRIISWKFNWKIIAAPKVKFVWLAC
jgi:hypothetical protein